MVIEKIVLDNIAMYGFAAGFSKGLATIPQGKDSGEVFAKAIFATLGTICYGMALFELGKVTVLQGKAEQKFFSQISVILSVGTSIGHQEKIFSSFDEKQKKAIQWITTAAEVFSLIGTAAVLSAYLMQTEAPVSTLHRCACASQLPFLIEKGYQTHLYNMGGIKGTSSSNGTKPSFIEELTAETQPVEYLGRENIIEKVLDILYSDAETNNVILNGEAGTGKTEMARYLAYKIRNNELKGFEGAKVFMTTATEFVAGQKWIGDTEARVKELFDFLEGQGEVILFIDEIHQLIGTGQGINQNHGIDGMFLTKLTNPKIHVIGAATPTESLSLDKNLPFKKRFTMIGLPPMSDDLRQKICVKKLASYSPLSFPADFSAMIIQYNKCLRNSSVREDKQLIGSIVARMKRTNLDAAAAFTAVTEVAYSNEMNDAIRIENCRKILSSYPNLTFPEGFEDKIIEACKNRGFTTVGSDEMMIALLVVSMTGDNLNAEEAFNKTFST